MFFWLSGELVSFDNCFTGFGDDFRWEIIILVTMGYGGDCWYGGGWRYLVFFA